MNRIACALAACALVAASTPAHAGLLVYESFSYSAGTDLVGSNGGTGFSGAWQSGGFNVLTGTNYDVASNSLPFVPLQTAGGSVATAATNFIAGATRNLATPLADGSTYYLSFLIRPDGTPLSSQWFGLNLTGTGASDELFVGKPGGGAAGNYVLENRGGTGQVSSGASVVAGQTTLLVLKMNLAADQYSLFVNPTVGGVEPALANAVKAGPAYTSIIRLGLYSSGGFSVDELRIGTTWADVVPAVPEPATALLLGAALLPLARRMRRGRE